jgi:hypothetical protein
LEMRTRGSKLLELADQQLVEEEQEEGEDDEEEEEEDEEPSRAPSPKFLRFVISWTRCAIEIIKS